MAKLIETGLLFLTLFFLFLIPTRDTDFGWHYRCGQELVTLEKFCGENHFTYLLDGFKWRSPSQGYDLLLYFLYKDLGFPGITIFYAASAAIVFTFFVKTLRGSQPTNVLMIVAGLWFSWSVFDIGFRSQILSIYFLMMFMALINIHETNKKYLFLLPVLSIFWSNFHSGFFLGPLVVLALLAQRIFDYQTGKATLNDLKLVAIISALTILATILNPFGPAIYQEVARHAQVPLNTLIAEWVPPLPWQILIIIFSTFFVVIRLWQKESKNIFGIILVSFFAFLAFEARRNLPLFSITAVFGLASTDLMKNWPRPLIKKQLGRGIYAFALVALIAIFAVKNLPLVFRYDEEIYSRNALMALPYDGVRFMRTQEPGYIFNTYEWGGYLIWKLPEFKIFADGRMPSWDTSNERQLPENWKGKSPYTIYIEIIQTQPGWQEALQAYKTDYIMIQSGAYLDLVLKSDQKKLGFQNIYDKEGVSIFKRV
jgi:hypothetical protein